MLIIPEANEYHSRMPFALRMQHTIRKTRSSLAAIGENNMIHEHQDDSYLISLIRIVLRKKGQNVKRK